MGIETEFLFPSFGPAVAYHSDSNRLTVPKETLRQKAAPVESKRGFFMPFSVR